eukprot:scaffold122884_cov69-Phaeocystis_antarctica.AAC.2
MLMSLFSRPLSCSANSNRPLRNQLWSQQYGHERRSTAVCLHRADVEVAQTQRGTALTPPNARATPRDRVALRTNRRTRLGSQPLRSYAQRASQAPAALRRTSRTAAPTRRTPPGQSAVAPSPSTAGRFASRSDPSRSGSAPRHDAPQKRRLGATRRQLAPLSAHLQAAGPGSCQTPNTNGTQCPSYACARW